MVSGLSIVHIQQPQNSSLCGQSCVAMYCGVTLEESVKAFASKGGTRTRQVISVIQSFGVDMDYKPLQLIKKDSTLPETCIIKIVWEGKKRSHWILKKGNVVHDPSYASPCTDFSVYNSWLKEYGKMTSYLELK